MLRVKRGLGCDHGWEWGGRRAAPTPITGIVMLSSACWSHGICFSGVLRAPSGIGAGASPPCTKMSAIAPCAFKIGNYSIQVQYAIAKERKLANY